MSSRPHRTVIKAKQARDVVFDRPVLPTRHMRDNLAICLRLGMPNARQGDGHEGLCGGIIAGPWRLPDRAILRKATPQDRRRAACFSLKPIDFPFVNPYRDERLLEGVGAE